MRVSYRPSINTMMLELRGVLIHYQRSEHHVLQRSRSNIIEGLPGSYRTGGRPETDEWYVN